ncbi:MAG: antibiotic biosynthesis monooxygenase [Patescibacteria group bacterium]
MSNKILSIVEGKVTKDKWSLLKDAYERVDKNSLPNSLLGSDLVQDVNEPEIWRIVTVWENIEAMSTYRKSVETPAWILVFKEVGVEPRLVVNEIVSSK